MRIIAGLARGMPLTVPPGQTTRPTSDRVREAIFSSLGGRVVGATVLDLFAGSGALGLEAASRGARSVTLVERHRAALTALERNVAEFVRRGGTPPVVVREDVFRFLKRAGRYDLVLADPPYGELAQRVLAAGVAADWLVLESAKREPLLIGPPWELVREAVYGDTRVSILKPA
jgi:16S rRNA (guanine966-N2)-methyltransferase